MEKTRMLRQKGFTLMELMVVVAIIGIIAAVAYPSYIKSAYKGRRAEGKAALNLAAQTLERCYANYGLYNSGNCGEVATLTAGTPSTPEKYYTITGTLTGTSYVIAATASSTGPQANDTGCTILTMNSTGQQGSGSTTATTDASGCW